MLPCKNINTEQDIKCISPIQKYAKTLQKKIFSFKKHTNSGNTWTHAGISS
jgi:hypothetical protein